MRATLDIARLTILEARRRRTFLAGVLLSFLFVTGIMTVTILAERASAQERSTRVEPTPGADETSPPTRTRERHHDIDRRFASQAIRVGGLWTMRTFAALMAIVLAAGAIASERESGTLHTLVTKPIRRTEVLAGKWLGLNAILLAYSLALGLFIALVLTVHDREIPWSVFRVSLANMLLPMLFVTLTLLFSILASAWVAVGLGLFAWAVGIQEYGPLRAIAFGLKQIGREAAGQVVQGACTLAGLLVPVGRIAGWIDRAGGAVQFPLPSVVPRPTADLWDLLYLLVYFVVAFAAAAWTFERRDL